MIGDMFDVFFFDLDGVIYIGGETTPGAVSVLDALRSMGKTIRFLTNNPTTRVRIADRLRGHGVAAGAAQATSANTVARTIKKAMSFFIVPNILLLFSERRPLKIRFQALSALRDCVFA